MMLDTNRYHFIVHNPDGRSIAEQQVSASQRKNTDYEVAGLQHQCIAGRRRPEPQLPVRLAHGRPGRLGQQVRVKTTAASALRLRA
jgi:hypothetical protein